MTVRTLHHYDEIGLLRPSLHTESGHRLYTAADVARLQQILSLRQLGFALEEIRDCLDRPGFSPLEVIRLHVARLRDRIAMEQGLCERLEAIAARLRGGGGGLRRRIHPDDRGDDHDRELLHARAVGRPQEAGRAARRGADPQSQEEWAELIAEVRAEMDKGTDPSAPEVQAMARRWMALVNAFTGGDPGIERSLGRLWKEQGDTSPPSTSSRTTPGASRSTSAGRWRR